MENFNLTDHEQALAGYDFNALNNKAQAAKTAMAKATSVDDFKKELCKIWGEIKPFVPFLEKIPFVGKFIAILADVLNSICS